MAQRTSTAGHGATVDWSYPKNVRFHNKQTNKQTKATKNKQTVTALLLCFLFCARRKLREWRAGFVFVFLSCKFVQETVFRLLLSSVCLSRSLVFKAPQTARPLVTPEVRGGKKKRGEKKKEGKKREEKRKHMTARVAAGVDEISRLARPKPR